MRPRNIHFSVGPLGNGAFAAEGRDGNAAEGNAEDGLSREGIMLTSFGVSPLQETVMP
jgi:hypothetical protein